MSLHTFQALFTALVPGLIQQAIKMGFEPVIAEVERSKAQAAANAASGAGIANSLHCERLAIDLMLFKNGVYLTDTEDYRALGTWWKAQNSLCRWGGDFKSRPDGNHFSVTPDGKRA